MSPSRAEFVAHCARSVPSTLASFDIAGFAQYNDALGHARGDQAIVELEAVFRRHLPQPNDVARWGSNTWLARLAERPVESAEAIISDFGGSLETSFGWRARARRGDVEVVAQETSRVLVRRALRCLMAPVGHAFEVKPVAFQLLEHCHGFEPGSVVWLAELDSVERVAWYSVNREPIPDPYCPVCKGGHFSWVEGDTTTYGGDGTCLTCGVEVSFSNAIGALYSQNGLTEQ